MGITNSIFPVPKHEHRWRSRMVDVTGFSTRSGANETIVVGWDCIYCGDFAHDLDEVTYEELVESVISEAMKER